MFGFDSPHLLQSENIKKTTYIHNYTNLRRFLFSLPIAANCVFSLKTAICNTKLRQMQHEMQHKNRQGSLTMHSVRKYK